MFSVVISVLDAEDPHDNHGTHEYGQSSELMMDLDQHSTFPSPSNPPTSLQSQVTGSHRPTSRADEQEVLLAVMSQSVGFLFRLAVLIRAPGTEVPWSKALAQIQPLPDLFDHNHIVDKHPNLGLTDGRALARRIAQANVKRRQFIRYCSDHGSHLSGKGPAASKDRPSEHLSTKATTLPHGTILGTLREVNPEDTDSLFTTSTAFDGAGKLRLPTLNSLSPGGEPFQCPICFTIKQPEDEKSWKKHAFSDLRAYCCTLGGGKCDSEMFGDRQSWFEHEVSHHRSRFTCILCSEEYPGEEPAIAHFKKSHGSLSHDQISALVESGRTAPASYRLADCPFCDWVAARRRRRAGDSGPSPGLQENETIKPSEFKRHVAMHQEQLALFVLPLSQLSGDDGSDGGENEMEARQGAFQSDPEQHSQYGTSSSRVAAFATTFSEDEVVEKVDPLDISPPPKDTAPTEPQTREDSLETREGLHQSAKKEGGDTTNSAVGDEHSSSLHSKPGASNLGTKRASDQVFDGANDRSFRGGSKGRRITVWFCVGAYSVHTVHYVLT